MSELLEECPHDASPKFAVKLVRINLEKIQQGHQLVLKISVRCGLCGQSFTFRGQSGLSLYEASTSYDYRELLVPVDYPSPEDPDVLPEGEDPYLEEEEEVIQAPKDRSKLN